MATFCPTALTKSNRDRLKVSQSPWAPPGMDSELAGDKEKLALPQGDLRAAHQERTHLAERVASLQRDLEAKNRGRLQECTQLLGRQQRTQQLLDTQREIVAQLQNSLCAHTAQLESLRQQQRPDPPRPSWRISNGD